MYSQFDLSDIKKQHQIIKAQQSLLEFTCFTKPDYKVNVHHDIICRELDDFLFNPENNRLMVFAPPRKGKSEIISRRFPAYAFGHFPDYEMIMCSYSADLAQRMNRDVQRVIDDPLYREVFPDTTLNGKNVKTSSQHSYIRTSDMFEIVNHKGAYRSAGVGGGITGMGANIAIIDDPLKDMAEAMSTRRKQLILEWYQSTLATRVYPGGKIVIVLTRWAEDDLAGELLKIAKSNPKADQWRVISFPEMYTESNEFAHPEDLRQEGDVLWPDVFSKEEMEKTRASLGSKVWASLYQQEPRPDDGEIIKTTWFKYYDELPEFDHQVISWDLSFKDSTGSDYVACTVWGIKGTYKYLLYVLNDKLNFVDTVKEMLRVNAMFPNAKRTIVEDKANGPAVISTLKQKIPGLIPYSPKEGKLARASAAAPQFEAGQIWLPNRYYKPNLERMTWINKYLDDFLEQFKAFPFATNDDMVDSVVQMILKIGEMPQWFQDLIAEGHEETGSNDGISDRDRMLADMMGWDLDGADDDGSGLPFDLNF